MLKRIYADNYRCLVNFELRPEQVNLLVGENGGGKSCIFEVLEAIQDIVVLGGDVDTSLPKSTLTAWDTRDVQRFELDIEGNDGVYQYVMEVGDDRIKHTREIKNEQVTFNKKAIYRFEDRTVFLFNDRFENRASFPTDPKRSFLSILEERPENTRLTWFKKFIQALWVLRLDPLRISGASKEEVSWLERDGTNLASWYRSVALEHPEGVDKLREDMKESFDGFHHFKLIASGSTQKELIVAFSIGSEGGRTHELSLGELSPGQRTLFALYAVMHFTKSAKVLCFDEPDNFVALREIQPWLVKLRDAIEERGAQLLMISHHPEVIDYLASGTAFKIERPNGTAARARPLSINLDHGLKASEVIARGWEDE